MTIIYIWLISDDFDVGHFMSDLMVITSIVIFVSRWNLNVHIRWDKNQFYDLTITDHQWTKMAVKVIFTAIIVSSWFPGQPNGHLRKK